MKNKLSAQHGLKFVKLFFPWLSVLVFLLANKTMADSTFSVDRNLLVGEWSKPGQCSKSRFIYTSDGRYMRIEKNGTNWRTIYNGIYVTSPGRTNAVVIAEGLNMGGEIIDIRELTPTTYKGEWQVPLSESISVSKPEDTSFSYVRCEGTALRR